MNRAIVRVEDAFGRRGIVSQMNGGPDRSLHEVSTAVFADPSHLIGALGAVGALEGADASVWGFRWQIDVTTLATWL